MTEARSGSRTFRFGVFEIDADTGELRKEGKAQPRLRDQSLRILLMLLERPRDLVSRDELREKLWSSDTFVDFDHGLNTAINQLRNALGDSASNPRFIQTLPRRGYRFIAPVEMPGMPVSPSPAAPGSSAPVASAGAVDGSSPRSLILSDARDLPVVSGVIARTLFSLVQLLYLTFYIVSLARLSKISAILAAAQDPVRLILTVLIITAAAGIPVRLYLLSATAFNYHGLNAKFRRLFPFLLLLDELWALAPFLLVQQIGIGLAIAATAALLYLPFSQRSLLLMASSHRAG
ncbi:MAG TPA: winged helix-turn-helix domain-containing protein [Candidatus Acidoferrales bacterium]|nr:winged helix-turn-helix domain-containing protein [Candidatus Acidoferrales bacterium]